MFKRVAQIFALLITMSTTPAIAAEKLVVSIWGGSWKEMAKDIIAEKFMAETGAEVEFITGGTIDRLNKAKLSKDAPESDVTFTTSHVGWLYVTSDLFEPLDFNKIPNSTNLVAAARVSPYHIGTWAYVYTIAFRTDIVTNVTFESWADLWKPELKGLLAAPDFDPSHIIAVAAMLSGTDPAHWERGQEKLLALKPNFKAFYTNDANSQQLIASGETPVQIILSMNAHFMIKEGVPIKLVMPKEGAVLGLDTVAIMKGSKQVELAHKFINVVLDPEVQARIATFKKGSPTVTNAKLPSEIEALPGVFAHPEQWRTQAIVINDQLRAEKLAEWRKWFFENIIGK